MNSITDATVHIQTSSEAVPATPPWLGEAALLVRHLDKQGVLDAISEQVREEIGAVFLPLQRQIHQKPGRTDFP